MLNPDEYHRNDWSKIFSITINTFSKTLDIALIGGFYSCDFDCAVIDEEILTILQNDAITQLNVLSGAMVFHKRFECLGCNLGLHKIKSSYVVHGEREIVMLDENFVVKWKFSGHNIFLPDKTSFELSENSIKLHDLNDEYYEIDYDGNLIQ